MVISSEKQIERVDSDLETIYSNENKMFQESIKYSKFIDLLSKCGMSEVANHYGFSIEFGNLFSIDVEDDLRIILLYWLVRYGENVEVNVCDLIDEMESSYVYHLFPGDDVIEECLIGKNIKNYRLLSEEDKIRLQKEIEEDKNILVVDDHIFFINDFRSEEMPNG
jgi:hypothetical protein